MEEGAEAFRNVLEKLLNLAMELVAIRVFGSGTIRVDEPAARSRQRLQGQYRGHAGGTSEAQDPPGEAPVVLPLLGLILAKGWG